NKSLQDGQYHIYKLVRDDKSLQIFIDDTKVTTFNLDEIPGTYLQGEFYILLNLAVGGDFTGILDASGITAIQDEGSVEMCVDWIRITEL
ncbi:MAG: glycoside hydrolase family 16 protein, partial [Muribaculaceae bacterium]|nr:glycoside hydrolase family 16 protein [Muribaculaceae bacterium]